ncbi:MAG: COG1361 S-layer family protein [Candidatus Woesearchaeota archaeon]
MNTHTKNIYTQKPEQETRKGLTSKLSLVGTAFGFLFFAVMIMIMPTAEARLQLNSIHFDPAIIAAGDEVDIIIQYEAQSSQFNDRIGNPDYSFRVVLEPDDRLTEEYVLIQDAVGNEIRGSLVSGLQYNKKFRVRVLTNAPAGNYEFKLSGQWYRRGVPIEGTQFLRFMMPVKREGIILDIAHLRTMPAEIRPGFNYVTLTTSIENVGAKDSKAVEVHLELPEGFRHSYSDANRRWVGMVPSMGSKDVDFVVDVLQDTQEGLYNLEAVITYMDEDDNRYNKTSTIPLFVKPRPFLEIVSYEAEAVAGSHALVSVEIKNTGTQSAEGVDVRLVKQSSQPFTVDVRSDYVGKLTPNESGFAQFKLQIHRDAQLKEHDLQFLIRAKGDSDEGDDTIYTYTRNARLDVYDTAPNTFLTIGIFGAIVVIIGGLILKIMNNGQKKRRK